MIDSIANKIYSDRYNNVFPISVRREWRRRDFLSWFHPFSLMDKAAGFLPGTFFTVGVIVGYILGKSKVISAKWLLVIQLLLFFFMKQPDRLTGEPLVTDLFAIVKIIGVWLGWWLSTKF